MLTLILDRVGLKHVQLQTAFALYNNDTEKSKIINKATADTYVDQGEGLEEAER